MCSFSSSIFKLWFHLNVPLNHFNDRWQFYESPIPRKIGDVYATMYYWSRIPLHMGISTNNTRAAKLGYQAKKELTFEPKGLPERDTMFLYIPLFMAKWAARMNNIYINITSWPNNQFTPAWAKVQIKAPAKAISIWKSASSLMTTRAAGVGISHANQTPWLWWIKWTWSVVVSAVTNLGILFPISGSEA